MVQSIAYLLTGDPWVEYRTRLDLLGEAESDLQVADARQRMLDHPLVKGLVNELADWPGAVVSSHKSAGQLYHKLALVADLGLTGQDPGMPAVMAKVMEHQAVEGPYQLAMNIPVHFGGTGQDQWAWVLCDAPLLLYSLARLGQADHPGVLRGVSHCLGLARENGWPCAGSREIGKFRGPGRKDDPCPYVNLIMLKLLALYPAYRQSREAVSGVECLLALWENSLSQHPYLFYMGTDFRKLKAPFIWYDILHLAEVLSQYEAARSDQRFRKIVAMINAKADSDGLFTPASEWKAWKTWDFGQKKRPSAWLTFLVHRINQRIE